MDGQVAAGWTPGYRTHNRYTQLVLTVIAVCLIYLCVCVAEPRFSRQVEASAQPSENWARDVKAQAFTVVDTEGRRRGLWSVTEEGLFKGYVSLTLYDIKGKVRACVQVNDLGYPGISLFDAEENVIIGMGVGKESKPAINIFDKKGGKVWMVPD